MLSPTEQDILVGKQDNFLAALLADSQMAAGNLRVSDLTEADLKQNFLAQPTSQQVITALHQGCSLRDAAAMASVSVEVALPNIQHTIRYTELSPDRFKNFWLD